jgi:hypothetical protein
MSPRNKLVVFAFELPDRSTHFFNELLGYKIAAESLGLVSAIFVPRSAEPSLALELSASATLSELPRSGNLILDRAAYQLPRFSMLTRISTFFGRR